MLAMRNVVSGVNEATGRRVFRLKKPKRRGNEAGINGFGIIITETRGACVIAKIWLNRRWADKRAAIKENKCCLSHCSSVGFDQQQLETYISAIN